MIVSQTMVAQCSHFVPGPYSATLLGNLTIDGLQAESDDELSAYDMQGMCLGKSNIVNSDGLSFFNLVVYGDDPTTSQDEGLMEGDVFVLEIHDVSSGELTLFNGGTPISGWTNANGAPLSNWTDPYQTLNFTNSNVCLGDFDGSGAVEVTDLLELLSAYGTVCEECAADLDNDGTVQVTDLLNFLSVYGVTC